MVSRLLVLALLVLSACPAEARSKSSKACAAEIGAGAAASLVRDCREASPAAAALCRPETPCAAMRQMIAEACGGPGGETKPGCRDVDPDAEDDEDDEDEN